MSRSLNETQSLVKAAARGAGLSWGEALDYASAMRWMGGHGINAWSLCADHLEDVAAGALVAPNAFAQSLCVEGALCPVRCGLMLSDHRFAVQETGVTIRDLAYPVLILPFLALSGQGMRLSGTEFSVTVTREGWDGSLPPHGPVNAQVQPATVQNVRSARQTRVPLSDADCHRLLALAAKTYAPATEASRLAGAGAGLSDTD